MKELIKTKKMKNGEILVSSRELHQVLGVKTRFSLWVKQNFKHFSENEDFSSVVTTTQQNQFGGTKTIQDYAMKIDMAKHIAMMAGTPKGFEIRGYFIELEKQYKQQEAGKLPKTPMQILSVTFDALKQADEKIENVSSRVTEIEENTPIHPSFLQEMSKKRSARVTAFLGGKKSQAYKNRSFRDSVYAEAAKDFKDRFKVNKYSLTLSKDIPDALEYFETWMPKEETLEEIRRLNSQIELLEEN